MLAARRPLKPFSPSIHHCLFRRLRYESLEDRLLLSVMRVAAWNTLNNPNDLVADADFATVLAAIGNQNVLGTAQPLDILALSETDTVDAGGNSIGRIESILDDLYPGTDYDSVASSLDGGGDATGVVYNTSTVDLLDSLEVPGVLTHSILRSKFRPAGTGGDSDFFIYSIHLKAGSTGADESRRTNEAAVLRADADALGQGAHIMFMGDFNMKDSFELAYANLVAAGPGQLRDVVPNSTGNWFENASFKSLHTQDPGDPASGGGGMDDRFDLQFASGELFDDFGLDYIDGSYRVLGNNGTHTLNAGIQSGTGAQPNRAGGTGGVQRSPPRNRRLQRSRCRTGRQHPGIRGGDSCH